MAITHQIVTMSNDTGYYVGQPYNLYVDRGNAPGGTATVRMQHLDSFWWMKSILKTAGWRVTAWGSGSTTGIYSDPFSSSLSMTSDAGWWCLTHPISSRSFVIQKSTPASSSNEGGIANYHSQFYRMKYSPGGFAISGTLSAKNAPGPQTGSQELIVYGGGTDALPTFTSWSPAIGASSEGGTNVFHCVAQTTGSYGFVAWISWTGKAYAVLAFDPVVTNNSADTEPYVVICDGNAGAALQNIGSSTGMQASTRKWTWVRQGLSLERSGAIVTAMCNSVFNQAANGGDAGIPQDKVGILLPITYVCSQTNLLTCSYKGISTLFKATNQSSYSATPHDIGTFSVLVCGMPQLFIKDLLFLGLVSNTWHGKGFLNGLDNCIK